MWQNKEYPKDTLFCFKKMNSKKFFITTPIYYINDVPHIGHTCTTVAADIVARLHRQLGEEVFFLTGTDEHGQKVAEAAEKENLSPGEYCDKIAPRFEEAWKNLNISNDFFIRTTDPKHEKVVGEVLQKIYDKGDVHKAKYEGWYCVGCEKFVTESELVDKHCPLHPPEKTVWKSEENWFFKLSKYVPKIIELIENPETNFIFPEGKRGEVLAKLKAGVNDISLSRENVAWGIPLPWDKTQTAYVWFDALINYYSATQFVEGKKEFWPADLHLLGKEILWFHTVIWQAMLLSAEIDLPKKTFTHSFYMIDGQKMSKSLGNVISPQQLVDLFGIDGTRYLIARSFPTDNDSDVGIERFKERYNADLANNLGNLVSRVAKLAEGESFENLDSGIEKDPDYEIFIKLINELKFNEAIEIIFRDSLNAANLDLNKKTPWKLDKEDPERKKILKEIIQYLLVAIKFLKPIMPDTCEKIEEVFKGEIKPLETGLFPRIK
ncbi:MAG: Methionine-tRNA ligase [Candidatus Shapirobacteria bacterium GW2011_GWE1_38_10]|uniref:Methionine--tRNA ligase n=1 Tax=Candidatus Shapirobacteria bacterium GW2011_GWE1_38_10 TaxID=1618488 RepID=A0A0G0LB62_9BACT|nr:MAG: Methionine-tRNA ligase [Candidatus Shapirobacteria bacterium GW2011_GWF2_37_20]KKQ49921.1 MAG: Methionine-tRNA ligase [Candidatus Shapirobacteria bacterium GW2011_GWE1_38_10]KKQ64349.1 MAG: Methionine-tRNA ligase [Candidatus Shapirobacteria bacterium GW2011_GWF1_38_23]HBP51535.1 methionine--tRNA ligase [Candidatus Shapirobacteria bacterium]